MNTEKLEKLKKSLDNKFIPDSMKDKIRTEIQKLESEIKEKEVTPTEIKEEIKNIEVKVEDAIEVAEKKEEKQEKATRKTTPKAKAPTEKKSKPTAMALAKEIRKEGETWKDAVARATKEMNGVKEEVKKETKSEIEKLKSLIRKRKDLKGVSSSDLMRDGHRKALPSGKRTSATGHTYYENRRNRTDKGKVGNLYLAEGGSLNSYNVIYSTKSGRTMVAKNIMATNKAEAEAKLKKEMSASNTFDKVVMVHESFAKGGAIPNNYEGKTANQVWDMWTPLQREHFLADHYDVMDKDDLGAKNKSFKELNFLTQSQLELHIEQGQYANGGGVWSEEQRLAVAKLDADFEKEVKEKGIDRNSKDAHYLWRSGGFQKRMAKIFNKEYANGGMMNNMSVHEGTDFMNTPVYEDGGFMDGVYVEEGAEIDKRDKQGMIYALQEHISSGEIANMTHLLTYDSIAETRSKAIQYYVKYGDKPYSMTELKNVLSIVSTPLYHKYRSEFADGGDFMNSAYAEEGAEVTYTRNKDGIRVKSVAMPEERLTEAEWLAKHNESREARTYAVGGGIFADTFSGYTGTHYTGLVGETNAMSSGEMFMAGGRVRRTKAQMTKDRENKEIDAYNWYVVDLEENKAITGNEYREDAVDALSDYDGDKRYKVVSKKTLKSLGIENPNERFKSYEVGGGVGELFPYAVGNDFTKENSFEISKKDIKKYKSMGFEVELLPRKDIDLLKKIQLADEKKLIERKIYDEIQRNDKRTDIQKTQDEIKELGFSFSNEIKEYDSLNWHYNIIDNDTGEVYGYEVDSKTMIAYPINEESKDYINMINHKYAVGGGVGDLFQNYDEQPEELAEITNFYAQKFDEDDYDYEDSKNFLKAVEAIGYTFDYGLDNEPYGLRPIGTELDEYADGGAIANQQLIADAHLRPAEMFGREGIPAYNKGGALKTERRYVNHSQDYETRYARKHPSRHGYGNMKYDGGGDVTQFGKFISSQIEHLISLKTIASKKEPIQNLLKNMDDYRGTEIEKRITTDNLKYALQQKTVSKMNEVLRISLNALKD